MWFLLIPGVIIIFVAVLLIRAAMFKPEDEEAPVIEEVPVSKELAAAHLAQMVRCRTISSRDAQLMDESEFEKFRQLLRELYPNVHKACTLERIGPTGLLYTLKGKEGGAPTVFMSHYDVVPADEQAWDRPAFEGDIIDGVVWGRGTLDTKGTLCGVMEAAEALLVQGFKPENDLYFAFAGDEEIAGESAPAIVDELHRRGIVPGLVVDEGGAVVNDIFPGITRPCAVVGIAEKGMLDVELSMETKGGHASAPPPHTSVGLLAQAVTRIENKPFKARLTMPVAAMFDTLGRHSSFVYRIIFANMWCFMPLLDAMCRKRGGELNAMMRTTCAFTMMEGSKASNVLPPVAKVGANLRIIGGDTAQSAVDYLKATANNPDINFDVVYAMDPSGNSVVGDDAAWKKLKSAIAQTWPDALVSPYLMFACSDSRHYCRISDHVYRFSAMALSAEDRAMIHGHNERISIDKLEKIVQFYIRLMRHC